MPFYGKKLLRKRGRASRRMARKSVRSTRKSPWLVTKGQKSLMPHRWRDYSKTVGGNVTVDGPLIARSTFPPSMYVEHRYVEQINISNENITGLTGAEYAFRLNSLFDPNFTGTGHQPLYFDQVSAIYDKYQVYRVKVHIEVAGVGSGSVQPFLAVNVRPSANLTSYTLASKWYDEVKEKPENSTLICKPSTIESTDNCLEFDLDLAQVEGISRAAFMDDVSFAANANTNPTLTEYLTVALGSINRAPGCSAYVTVCLTQYAKWSSPHVVGAS